MQTLLIFVTVVLAIESGHAARYQPHKVLPGQTERLVCLEDVPFVNRIAHRAYFKWFYEGKRLNLSLHPGKWLDNDTRTLVIDDVSLNSVGKYKCICKKKRSGKTCQMTRTYRKSGRKVTKLLVQRIHLQLEEAKRIGYCKWTDKKLLAPEYQYNIVCKCFGGAEQVCGRDMKIQRIDRKTEQFVDVQLLDRRPRSMSFMAIRSHMEISGRGSNITYENAGQYRCVTFDRKGEVLCQSGNFTIVSDDPAPPPPSPIVPFIDEHIIWYGFPALAIFTFTFSFICGRLIYYRCTSRVIVQAKNSNLIRKYVRPDDEEAGPGVSNPPIACKLSSSSIYPDLESVSPFV